MSDCRLEDRSVGRCMTDFCSSRCPGKLGYCTRNPFLNREACCEGKTPLVFNASEDLGVECTAFKEWSSSYAPSFAIYVAFALAFGIISSNATMLTKRSLPAASPGTGDKNQYGGPPQPVVSGKSMYMAAGSGIPEIKTILSGFVIPNFVRISLSRRIHLPTTYGPVLLVSRRHSRLLCLIASGTRSPGWTYGFTVRC